MTSAIREQLKARCEEATGLHDRLAAIVHLRDSAGGDRRAGKLDHSQPPWNAAAASCLLELHALARVREAEWRQAANFSVRGRGGSDENTRKALAALSSLSHSVDDERVTSSLRELARWCRNARVVLGEMEMPRRLPAPKARGSPRVLTAGAEPCECSRCGVSYAVSHPNARTVTDGDPWRGWNGRASPSSWN